MNTAAYLHLEKEPPQFETVDKAHGRVETRSIWTSTKFVKNIPLPHVQQFCTIRREVFHVKSGKTTVEMAYCITSLPPAKASPEYLLACNRGHWAIENKSHHVRDVTFDEDRSQIRTGTGPQMMAFLRNFTTGLMRLSGLCDIASATRELAANPWKTLHLLGL